MEVNKIYKGNCLDLFKELDNESIDCVITSPPYWQLRDYKWDGQWGLEPTFELYLEHLWQMMDEVYRILKPTGTAWINLGDTYGTKSGNFVGGNIIDNKIKYTGGIDNYTKDESYHKCLLLIPHRFAIGCIERGWVVRNDIIWAKANAMPESVKDRFSKKHEYFFFMVKNENYFFDLDSVRHKSKTVNKQRNKSKESYANGFISPLGKGMRPEQHPNGKNPGSISDFWDITTKPSKGTNHFASYNSELVDIPISAGCPKEGIVLDPFCGTATTGCRALELGRKFIGFEGSEKFVKMGNKNLLPYLSQSKMF